MKLYPRKVHCANISALADGGKNLKRTLSAIFFILLILGGGGYLAYSRGWYRPAWVQSILPSSPDARLRDQVKTSLGLSKRLAGFDIEVEASGEAVTLRGQVPSPPLRSLAEEIARDTPGVKEVTNEIQVNPGTALSSEAARVEDLEVRVAILEAFARSPELAGKDISVRVDSRVVTLTGTVDTPAQRAGAEQVARAAEGVAGVTNDLAVTNPEAVSEAAPQVTTPVDPNAELARTIEFELFKSAAFDLSIMTIRADGGNVTLSGKVRSRAEQLLAERIAQGLHGVRRVRNELQVDPATR